ncbi:MAG: VWA domain-containing protein [Phaeodactylibacter sp.]|nr:VWA domain-containing protein [Phaeodactylibacter sp.]
MFRFEHPFYLYGLAAIPILSLLFYLLWRSREKAIRRFASDHLLARLIPDLSSGKHLLKFSLLMLALAFFVIGWANPQWGTKKEKTETKGIDLFIALDISQSMLAEDIPPNRLERAKRFGQNLVDQLKGNRIGLIFFAGNAYVQMPLSKDYALAMILMQGADPEQAATQGTALGNAIELAERAFPAENKNHKALLFLTDGENHDEEALAKAKEARENGLLIYTIGVGTESGSFVPVRVNGRQEYKRDNTGNPVRSAINVPMLQDLASSGGGQYFDLVDRPQVYEAIQTSIDQIEKRELELQVFDEYESYFQYFLAAGLLLIFVEFFISFRKIGAFERTNLFGKA